MIELTDKEREQLDEAGLWLEGGCEKEPKLVAAVESIVAKRVRDALREAADDYVNTGVIRGHPDKHWVAGWLRDRAAAIETEADDGR